jgi:hypothetical protein
VRTYQLTPVPEARHSPASRPPVIIPPKSPAPVDDYPSRLQIDAHSFRLTRVDRALAGRSSVLKSGGLLSDNSVVAYFDGPACRADGICYGASADQGWILHPRTDVAAGTSSGAASSFNADDVRYIMIPSRRGGTPSFIALGTKPSAATDVSWIYYRSDIANTAVDEQIMLVLTGKGVASEQTAILGVSPLSRSRD